MLQETHSDASIEELWGKKYEGKIYFSHGSSSGRGVALLIPKYMNEQVPIKAIETDKEGRILLVHTELCNRDVIVVNIYAPTKDNTTLQNNFLENLRIILENFTDKPLIIGGDFNTYLDSELDKRGGISPQTSSYKDNLIQFMEEFLLVDIWRLRNQDKRQFTWRGKGRGGIVQSRLDYFLVSVSLESEIDNTTIKPGFGTDHSLINLNIKLLEGQKRGRGYWKFNNSLLKDKDYIKIVKETIVEALSNNQFNNKRVLWDFIKCKIRTTTMIYSSEKAKSRNKREKEIWNMLLQLEENCNRTNNQNTFTEYENCKTEWETIQLEKNNGAILRSKVRFAEEGEKNSKYFLNLEKRNYDNKHMKSVINSKDILIDKPDQILEEQAIFFEKLYTSNICDEESQILTSEFLEKIDIPMLNEDQKEFLDCELSVSELSMALKEMSNDKSPGLDGFTTNFYKFFWADIKLVVLESFNYSLKYGELSETQKRGVLSLIPKNGKDTRYLKSWRPVSLLATDYKILAKTLATRLQKVISNLINPDQVGYIKGRHIGQNIRSIEDILLLSKKHNISGLLVLIDFEKAFDTVEWDFLFETLKSFNFGQTFRAWIKLLYTNISSCTINNGYFSRNFTLGRGIRQGCPLSALLFILVAEILSINLRANKEAKGITIDNWEYKIFQLADDTTILAKDLESLKLIITVFFKFQKISGLKLNLDKCEIVQLGAMMLTRAGLPNELSNLKINKGPFKTLGVWFSLDSNESSKLNYDERLNKINKILQIWSQRSLSWKGRIMIIKTLVLSQVVHLFATTFTPREFLVQLDKILLNFLWNKKPVRVKRETIIAPVESGGLKMPEVFAFQEAQKIAFMKNLLVEDGKCLNLFLKVCNFKKVMLDHKLSSSVIENYTNSKFHLQTLQAWFKVKNNPPEDLQSILNEYIFLNSHVNIDDSPIHPKDLGLDNDLLDLKIVDLLNKEKKFTTAEELRVRPGWCINIINIYSLLDAIPKQWKFIINNEVYRYTPYPKFSTSLNHRITEIKKVTSKKAYLELIRHVVKAPTAVETWLNLFPFLEQIEWNSVFTLVYKITKEPYLQSFQYKILNRTLNCRYNLYKWKISSSPTCIYCTENDTIEDHLYHCNVTINFWREVSTWLYKINLIKLSFTVCEVIFGLCEASHTDGCIEFVFNYIILLGKWYINKSRSNNQRITFSNFPSLVKEKLEILRMSYILKENLDIFNKSFGTLYRYFD